MSESKQEGRYASRKFLLTLGTLGCAFAAFVFGAASPAEVMDLTKWTLGLYFAGNVGSRLTNTVGGK